MLSNYYTSEDYFEMTTLSFLLCFFQMFQKFYI